MATSSTGSTRLVLFSADRVVCMQGTVVGVTCKHKVEHCHWDPSQEAILFLLLHIMLFTFYVALKAVCQSHRDIAPHSAKLRSKVGLARPVRNTVNLTSSTASFEP